MLRDELAFWTWWIEKLQGEPLPLHPSDLVDRSIFHRIWVPARIAYQLVWWLQPHIWYAWFCTPATSLHNRLVVKPFCSPPLLSRLLCDTWKGKYVVVTNDWSPRSVEHSKPHITVSVALRPPVKPRDTNASLRHFKCISIVYINTSGCPVWTSDYTRCTSRVTRLFHLGLRVQLSSLDFTAA